MKSLIKILHLEDNKTDAELVKEMLKLGGVNAEIRHVNTKSDYLLQLEKEKYDIVLCDYNLPDWDGLQALIDTKKRFDELPFIYVSGTIGEERAVQCLQFGAMDYVVKDRIDKLVPAVNRALRLVKETKERKKVESELARIKLAIENTGEAVFMTDLGTKFIYANPAFTRIFGWKPEEIIDVETPRILKSGFHDEAFYKDFYAKIVSNKPFSTEIINKTKNGKYIEVNNRISPIIDKDNTILGYVSILEDNSLAKEYERQIVKAKLEAEEMNKLKSYFLSNISHEMRTPLISIIGFSEILIQEAENKEHKEIAQNIYDAGVRLKQTINSILSLQELENRNVNVYIEKVELIGLIKNIKDEFEKVSASKGLYIKTLFERDEIWLNTDPNILRKIIENIFDNAVKFTKTGGILLSVSRHDSENISEAIIKIADTGIGISRDKLDRIFSPFRQESEGMSRPFEGMGLGLSISKQLVELLHAKISIESKIEKGTLVKIKLQAIPDENKLSASINSMKNKIVEPHPNSNGKPKILMVEDNPGNRTLFTRYLEKDFDLDIAENGISGIAKADTKQYSLILMDINLGPGIDGIETLKRIRALPNYSDIPIVAVTAYAMPWDKQKFLDYGFDDYLQKPLDRNELIEKINDLIKK
jgi:PAS domain S-box-containing protein